MKPMPPSYAHALMLRSPLVPAAAGLILGVLAQDRFVVGATVCMVLLTAPVAVLGRASFRNRLGAYAVAIAAFGAGALAHTRATSIPSNSVANYLPAEKMVTRIRGIVETKPRQLDAPDHPFSRWSYGHERTVFVLRVEAMQAQEGWIPLSGFVRVTVDEPVLELNAFDHVELTGWAYRMRPPANPGGFDWARFNRRRGIVGGISCQHRENIRLLDATSQTSLISSVRNKLSRLIVTDSVREDGHSGLLHALVLGQRSQVDRRIDASFVRAGCAHLLAVSGMHLAVPMTFVWWVGRRFSLPAWICACLMLGSIALYVFVAEPRPPILRAAVMGSMFSLAILFGRRGAAVNSLAAAALILVLLAPMCVFDIGFQLSFCAALSVLYLPNALRHGASKLRTGFESSILQRKWAASDRALRSAAILTKVGWTSVAHLGLMRMSRYLWKSILFSVAAWTATLPIVAGNFLQIHPLSPLATLVAFPLVYLLVLLAFGRLLILMVFPMAEPVFSWAINGLDRGLIGCAEILGNLPGATVGVAPPPWWWIASWYLLLVGVAAMYYKGSSSVAFEQHKTNETSSGMHRHKPVLILVLVLGVGLATLAWQMPRRPSDQFVVHVLSVGSGSATVVELPDGSVVVFDAGTNGSYDVGVHTIVPFFRHRGLTSIDRLYVSHPNLDHYNAIPSLLDGIRTGPVIVNRYFSPRSDTRSPSRHLLEQLERRSHPLEVLNPGQRSWMIGGVRVEQLWPPDGLTDAVSTNDTSSVFRLSFGEGSILLTGDIEEYAQRALLAQGGLESDVLILPHHGSVRSSTEAFIESVNPSVLVRSSGQSSSQTSGRLDRATGGRTVLNTADVGCVTITIQGNQIETSITRHVSPVD